MALTKISTGGVKDDAASQAKIADEAVDEARLQVSNAGSNGQFLSKQSGNTGGLTWATPTSYTHPNHSGEVTSTADGAQVIADDVVDEANLKVSNAPTNGHVLTAQSGNTGGLTWAAPSGGIATEYDALWLGGDNAYTDSDRWGNSHIGQGSASRGTLARVTNLSPVGNGVSVSGGNNPGYITFPSAGMWKIDWNLQVKRDTAGDYDIKMRVFHSTDSGSNFSVQAPEAVLAMDTYSGGVLRTNFTFFLNVTDASTHRIFLALYNSLGYDFQVSKNTLVQFSKIA